MNEVLHSCDVRVAVVPDSPALFEACLWRHTPRRPVCRSAPFFLLLPQIRANPRSRGRRTDCCFRRFARFREFENRHASKPRPAPLASPWTPAPRVAALAAWFPVDAPLVLGKFLPTELTAVAPEALAAPVETLRALATLALQTGYSLPALRFGAIALTGVGRAVPTDSDRDLLWRAFRVPLYTHSAAFTASCWRRNANCTTGSISIRSRPSLRKHPWAAGHQHRQSPLPDPPTDQRIPRTDRDEPCPCGLETPRLLDLAPACGAALAKQRFVAA